MTCSGDRGYPRPSHPCPYPCPPFCSATIFRLRTKPSGEGQDYIISHTRLMYYLLLNLPWLGRGARLSVDSSWSPRWRWGDLKGRGGGEEYPSWRKRKLLFLVHKTSKTCNLGFHLSNSAVWCNKWQVCLTSITKLLWHKFTCSQTFLHSASRLRHKYPLNIFSVAYKFCALIFFQVLEKELSF